MVTKRELHAYEEQINIQLLNDIMQFVIGTVDTPSTRIYTLRDRCIFPIYPSGKDALQQNYGFLYLGELLERYEERFGQSDADFRAIALALGYLKDVVTEDMFVGAQRINFLRQLERRASNDDFYLSGALCMLNEGQRNAVSPYQKMMERQYNKLEELIFALSIAPDFEKAFCCLKPQLLELLAAKRNMPLLGNTDIFDWLIVHLQPLLKTIRTKDMALFRALCALPTSYVRPGSRPHELLMDSGYSSLEISYANMMTVQNQAAAGVLRKSSIVAEKIAVELFRTALENRETLPDFVYQQLSELFGAYRVFDIKCYGTDLLLEAIEDCPPIQNVQTFAWFSKHASIDHNAFRAFDVMMDTRWDDLAVKMEPATYRALFDSHLSDDMDAEELRQRIARYETASGEDYLQLYWDTRERRKFCLLVEKGLINLWDAFTASLDNNGNIVKPDMLSRVESYLQGLPSVQAFQFLDCFLLEHGFDDWDKYFSDLHRFIDSLMERRYYNYGNSEMIRLKPVPEYMDAAMRRCLLYWLEEYYFQKRPARYLAFMVALLVDEGNAVVFPEEKLKALFKLLITESDLVRDVSGVLRERFMTAEEKEEEQAKLLASQQREKEQQQQAFVEKTLAKYKEATDGTICSIREALEDQAKYRKNIALVLYPVALQDLIKILDEEDYWLDSDSIKALLAVFTTLVNNSVLRFSDAQEYISNIKEEPEHEHEYHDIPAC